MKCNDCWGERYKNVRGQTVQITPQQPRHIPTLKDRRRITKVIASAYEDGQDTPPSV